ncbi:hypothetical protein ACFVYE_30525 [Streptomyces sp. NPDC058239]|uniref:hypothetical protein n=1 Tax=unclassified Streptomyces TaxID=2593676 RepID=UPI003648644D
MTASRPECGSGGSASGSDQGGWVQALGALHRGEPCGFTLMLRGGRHIEWHVRPLTYVSLDARTHHRPAPLPVAQKSV